MCLRVDHAPQHNSSFSFMLPMGELRGGDRSQKSRGILSRTTGKESIPPRRKKKSAVYHLVPRLFTACLGDSVLLCVSLCIPGCFLLRLFLCLSVCLSLSLYICESFSLFLYLTLFCLGFFINIFACLFESFSVSVSYPLYVNPLYV